MIHRVTEVQHRPGHHVASSATTGLSTLLCEVSTGPVWIGAARLVATLPVSLLWWIEGSSSRTSVSFPGESGYARKYSRRTQRGNTLTRKIKAFFSISAGKGSPHLVLSVNIKSNYN